MVRRAVGTDARAISEVHVESWRSAYVGLLPEALLASQNIDRRLAFWAQELALPSRPENSAWVVEVDGTVVGFASTGLCRDDDRAGGTNWELFAIYLRAESWGQGLGLALATAALRSMPEQADSVSLWVLAANARAIRFYERLGFAPDGREREELLGGYEVTERRFIRTLPYEG